MFKMRQSSIFEWLVFTGKNKKKLKAQTKDWQEHEDYSIICPDCSSELKNINEYKWEQ